VRFEKSSLQEYGIQVDMLKSRCPSVPVPGYATGEAGKADTLTRRHGPAVISDKKRRKRRKRRKRHDESGNAMGVRNLRHVSSIDGHRSFASFMSFASFPGPGLSQGLADASAYLHRRTTMGRISTEFPEQKKPRRITFLACFQRMANSSGLGNSKTGCFPV
jgi:hypothetical protein